jgi:hypothetical protein
MFSRLGTPNRHTRQAPETKIHIAMIKLPPPRPISHILLGALSAIAFITPITSHATSLNLACTNSNSVEPMLISVDFSSNKVWLNGREMDDVAINKNEITYAHNLGPAGKWNQKLNRITGNLLVQFPGSNDFLAPYKCEKAIQKF